MPRKKSLPETSSLNNYYQCDKCGNKFVMKQNIVRHLKNCSGQTKASYSLEKWRQKLRCRYCGIVYGNNKLLAYHISKVHKEERDTSENIADKYETNTSDNQPKSPLTKCGVCNRNFPNFRKYRCHRRKEHFNLKAKIPYCELKKVNQVWFEKVMNCNNIVEIHKKGPNTLVMRRLDENTAIKVYENNTKTIDLSGLYPIKY